MTLARAAVHPPLGVVAEAVQHEHHGIGLRAPRLVAGRRVDEEVAIVVGDGGVKGVPRDRAARGTPAAGSHGSGPGTTNIDWKLPNDVCT